MEMTFAITFTPNATQPNGAASRITPAAGRRLLGARLALREDRVR